MEDPNQHPNTFAYSGKPDDPISESAPSSPRPRGRPYKKKQLQFLASFTPVDGSPKILRLTRASTTETAIEATKKRWYKYHETRGVSAYCELRTHPNQEPPAAAFYLLGLPPREIGAGAGAVRGVRQTVVPQETKTEDDDRFNEPVEVTDGASSEHAKQ